MEDLAIHHFNTELYVSIYMHESESLAYGRERSVHVIPSLPLFPREPSFWQRSRDQAMDRLLLNPVSPTHSRGILWQRNNNRSLTDVWDGEVNRFCFSMSIFLYSSVSCRVGGHLDTQ